MRSSRGRGVVAGVFALLVSALAPAAASAGSQEPIVYVVVIDGLDGDTVEEGNAPFVTSLYDGTATDGSGSYFPGSRSVIPAETNPNHTAMMTGALPGKSGIAANAFAIYGDLVSEDSCLTTGPLDYSMLPEQTSGESPTCPQAETVFESVRRQAGGKHPVTSVVMGKPKLGRIFDVTYKGKRAADALWAPCDDTPEDDEYCADVPTNPVTGYAQNDTIVMDEVIAQVDGVTVNGKEKRADFTFVNLPMVDTIGHGLGRGVAYDNFARTADAQVERLADALKASGEWERTSIIVTSDHSMDTTPLKTSMTQTIQGAGVSEDDFTVVQNGSLDFVYLADRKAPKAERDALLKQMRDAMVAAAGVNEVLYRRGNSADGGREHRLKEVHPDWSSGKRTGDIVVTTDPGAAFSEPDLTGNPLTGNHGAPQTEDSFMAVIGGSPAIKTGIVDGESRKALIRNNDVAATVMRLLGLKAPKKSVGRPIKAAFKRGTLDRRR